MARGLVAIVGVASIGGGIPQGHAVLGLEISRPAGVDVILGGILIQLPTRETIIAWIPY